MIIIMSEDGWTKAVIEDGRDGIHITLWVNSGRSEGNDMWRLEGHTVSDVPFHVALDAAHRAIYGVKHEPVTTIRRR